MRGIDEYTDINNESSLDDFIREHRSIVYKIAKSYKRKLPTSVEFDDLLQSGFVGLLDAKRLFDASKGAAFETFASIKIRGAILDWLRKISWGTRQGIQNTKRIADCIEVLEQELKQAPTSEQIANKLGMTSDEYSEYALEASTCYVGGISDIVLPANENDSPAKKVEFNDLKQKILNVLEQIPEKEKIVLSLYYLDELTLKEISEVLSLTEARISQLHTQAIARLQKKLHVENRNQQATAKHRAKKTDLFEN